MLHLKQLLQNQLFSGGFMLMLTGAALALCKSLPYKVWDFLRRQLTVEVEVLSDDPIFEWLTIWLNEHPYSKRSRFLTASSINSNGYSEGPGSHAKEEARIIFSPAPGNHLLRYKGRFIWLNRNRKDKQTDGSGGSLLARMRNQEVYNIRVFGRKQDIVRQLLEDARVTAKDTINSRVSTYVYSYGWSRLYSFAPRAIESVVLPQGDMERTLCDIRRFLGKQEWYNQMGIPYHRGYLFHGVPGTGKTSLITALSGEFKMPLYVLRLSGNTADDEQLTESMRLVPERSIILLEDVDVATHSRVADSEGKAKGVTLSGLLNCLDGVMAKHGCLVFMTTNHRERLDPALIRPGRVDFELEFNPANRYQMEAMYQRFNPDWEGMDKEEFVLSQLPNKVTTASVQQELMVRFG